MKNEIELIADKFSELLLAEIGADNLRLVNKRNTTQEYAGACASHDFCDANIVMDEAFRTVKGITIDENSDEYFEVMQEDANMVLWEKAWNKAKEKGFNLPADSTTLDKAVKALKEAGCRAEADRAEESESVQDIIDDLQDDIERMQRALKVVQQFNPEA